MCALVLPGLGGSEWNKTVIKGKTSEKKVGFNKTRERVRSIGRATELLMIVTYMGVWLSLATRHDVTPE